MMYAAPRLQGYHIHQPHVSRRNVLIMNTLWGLCQQKEGFYPDFKASDAGIDKRIKLIDKLLFNFIRK